MVYMCLGERRNKKGSTKSSGSWPWILPLVLVVALKGRIIEIYGPESSGKTPVSFSRSRPG